MVRGKVGVVHRIEESVRRKVNGVRRKTWTVLRKPHHVRRKVYIALRLQNEKQPARAGCFSNQSCSHTPAKQDHK